MLYTAILPKESLLKIFSEVNKIRKDIYKILESLKFGDQEINKLLINLGSKLNSKVFITKNEGEDEIEYTDEFIDSWDPIYQILSAKFKFSEDLINNNKILFIDIFNLSFFYLRFYIIFI